MDELILNTLLEIKEDIAELKSQMNKLLEKQSHVDTKAATGHRYAFMNARAKAKSSGTTHKREDLFKRRVK